MIGAGIMSATLGMLLHRLDPNLTIEIHERLDEVAAESSDAWNNAGTGHSAFCELNYTPENDDGSVDVSKAIRIAQQFEVSKQFWAALVREGLLPDPSAFIRSVPHIGFVWGEGNVAFLRARFAAMRESPLFRGMQYSEDPAEIAVWAPLVMAGRDPSQQVAATRMSVGTDVNFGALTRAMIGHLQTQDSVTVHLGHEVRDFRNKPDGWRLLVYDQAWDTHRVVRARFVFIGAGGGAMTLLEASGIPEANGYGGFPVSGQWLRCTNREVIEAHGAKVYGKAAHGAPPMSMPHLDSRLIGGKKELLFGPYAGFSTKFLKQGSYTDLFRSIGLANVVPMIDAGSENIDLTVYLVGQVLMTPAQRVEVLRGYYPGARRADWTLQVAGQRVQVIKKDADGGGTLEFGTELVVSADRTLAGLLGASPGASTAVAIMIELVERCFPERTEGGDWEEILQWLVPSYRRSLHADPALCEAVRADNMEVLGLGLAHLGDNLRPPDAA